MIKKIAILTVLALALMFGVFGMVNTTHAQEIEAQESPEVQVMAQEEASYEYQYTYQYGDGNGDAIATATQSQTRTRLRELQDGECVGDGDQLQIRQQLHVNENQGEMRQMRQNLGDGTCDGECTPVRQGGQGRP
ncbi:MAG: hypothetical protein K0B06_02820 [Brevefilum sp.]|nr:hypothetical protein [Brevefilum sp.]